MELLDRITELSRGFGGAVFVRGGGGNTSVKDDTTLWVKPSGTTLATLKPTDFVALDRAKLGELYKITPPESASAREALVKEIMAKAVHAETPGRPSVEAPLHDTLGARYVVHTHPALVNGMTCGKTGKEACATLFPEALWVDYVDPGYSLCMKARREIHGYNTAYGRDPALIFLKNHGVFISADEPEEIRKLYMSVLNTLHRHYEESGVSYELTVGAPPKERTVAEAKEKICQAFGEPELCVAASGPFVPAQGPISPDHIVYAKSYYLTEEPTAEAIERFRDKHNYRPHVIAFGSMVVGVGPTQNKAGLALDLASDGALVVQLAEAFGGIDYMTDRAREFIENWEAESYRSKQVE